MSCVKVITKFRVLAIVTAQQYLSKAAAYIIANGALYLKGQLLSFHLEYRK